MRLLLANNILNFSRYVFYQKITYFFFYLLAILWIISFFMDNDFGNICLVLTLFPYIFLLSKIICCSSDAFIII